MSVVLVLYIDIRDQFCHAAFLFCKDYPLTVLWHEVCQNIGGPQTLCLRKLSLPNPADS